MNNKVLFIFTSLVLVILMSACAVFGNATEKYIGAFIKTNGADSMETKTEIKFNIDLSKASQEDRTKYKKYKEININMDEVLDNRNKKLRADVFFSAGDIVMDPKIYAEGNKTYIKFGDKYIRTDEGDSTKSDKGKAKYGEYKMLYSEFSDIWKDAVANEILGSEGNTIIYTPDGDIKVTQLTLSLTGEKQRNILGKLAAAVSKSSALKESVIENGKRYKDKNQSDEEFKKNIDTWFNDLIKNVDGTKNKYTLEDLKLTAKIDKDSYIIDQAVEGTLIIKRQGEIVIGFKMHTTRWNINSGNIKIDIPEIDDKDLMDVKDLESKDSEFIEKLFNEIIPK